MSFLQLSLVLIALQSAEPRDPGLFARFAEIGLPYVQCVDARGAREDMIVPAQGSDMSWPGARAAFRQRFQADDTECRFYATHEQLTRLVSQRYPAIDERVVGFVVQSALADLQRTSFRLENLDRLTGGLPAAPPAPPSPGRTNAQNQ